jgi:hypothetical protein
MKAIYFSVLSIVLVLLPGIPLLSAGQSYKPNGTVNIYFSIKCQAGVTPCPTGKDFHYAMSVEPAYYEPYLKIDKPSFSADTSPLPIHITGSIIAHPATYLIRQDISPAPSGVTLSQNAHTTCTSSGGDVRGQVNVWTRDNSADCHLDYVYSKP